MAVSINHSFFIAILEPSEQGDLPLTSRMLPPSSRIVSFDWNNIVEPLLPAYASFQIRVEFYSYNIYWCIVDEGAFTSILSSSTWKFMGPPKLMSTTSEIFLLIEYLVNLWGFFLVSYHVRWEYFPSQFDSGEWHIRLQYATWVWLCICYEWCGFYALSGDAFSSQWKNYHYQSICIW